MPLQTIPTWYPFTSSKLFYISYQHELIMNKRQALTKVDKPLILLNDNVHIVPWNPAKIKMAKRRIKILTLRPNEDHEPISVFLFMFLCFFSFLRFDIPFNNVLGSQGTEFDSWFTCLFFVFEHLWNNKITKSLNILFPHVPKHYLEGPPNKVFWNNYATTEFPWQLFLKPRLELWDPFKLEAGTFKSFLNGCGMEKNQNVSNGRFLTRPFLVQTQNQSCIELNDNTL